MREFAGDADTIFETTWVELASTWADFRSFATRRQFGNVAWGGNSDGNQSLHLASTATLARARDFRLSGDSSDFDAGFRNFYRRDLGRGRMRFARDRGRGVSMPFSCSTHLSHFGHMTHCPRQPQMSSFQNQQNHQKHVIARLTRRTVSIRRLRFSQFFLRLLRFRPLNNHVSSYQIFPIS